MRLVVRGRPSTKRSARHGRKRRTFEFTRSRAKHRKKQKFRQSAAVTIFVALAKTAEGVVGCCCRERQRG